jgi:transcriptional regulator with XRE-family HTH domain
LTYQACLSYQAIVPPTVYKLGHLLADARKRHGLTLRAVQDVIGISNAYLSQLETGKARAPSPTVLFKLSKLYQLPYAVVMKEAGYPLPENIEQPDWGSRLACRIGPISPEEEDEIVEYVMFLRSRRRRGWGR